MACYAFKFINANDNETGWIGIAYAENLKELFWTIDEFGDPRSCLIKPMRKAGVVFKEGSDIELTELLLVAFESEKFKEPKWPDDIYKR